MKFLSIILIFNLIYGPFAFVIRGDKDLKFDKNAVRNRTRELSTFSPLPNKCELFIKYFNPYQLEILSINLINISIQSAHLETPSNVHPKPSVFHQFSVQPM